VDAVFEDEEAEGGDAIGEIDGDDARRKDLVSLRSRAWKSAKLTLL